VVTQNQILQIVTQSSFLAIKKAYTATMKGVFNIDYADPNKIDLVDTFQFQLKKIY